MSLIKPSHRGLLHKRMGVSPGKKIPKGRIRADLKKAERTGNVKDERQDEFALNMGKRKGSGGGVVPRGEHHAENHREPRSHAEFEKLGNPGKP